MSLALGDSGVVVPLEPRLGRRDFRIPGGVVKLGRKWATVRFTEGRWTNESKFSIETGVEDAGQWQPTRRFLNPAMEDLASRIVEARARCRAANLGPYGGKWTDERVVALGEWRAYAGIVGETLAAFLRFEMNPFLGMDLRSDGPSHNYGSRELAKAVAS